MYMFLKRVLPLTMLFVAATVIAYALALQPPIGTLTRCDPTMFVSFQSVLLGNFELGNVTGQSTFRTTGVNGPDQPSGSTQEIVTLNASVDIPELGTVTWTNSGLQTEPTTVQANQVSGEFPATANINFIPEATISSQPGRVYRATQAVNLHSSNITTFPFVNESVSVGGPINFADVQTGEIAFTITLSDIVINP